MSTHTMSAAFAFEAPEPTPAAVQNETVAPVIPLNAPSADALPVADADFDFAEIALVLAPRFPLLRSTFFACRDLETSETLHIRETTSASKQSTTALCGTPFAVGTDLDVTVGAQGRLDPELAMSTCASCREEWTFFTAWDAVA